MAAVLFGGLTFAQLAMADRPGNTEGKVVICHVPPGNPDNPQTIAVDPESAAEHLAEHELDSEGECGAEPSTCQECLDAMNEGLTSCEIGDTECVSDVFQNLSDCSLTCTGSVDIPDLFEISQACFNEVAIGFESCLGEAATFEDEVVCLEQYFFTLFACAQNGA